MRIKHSSLLIYRLAAGLPWPRSYVGKLLLPAFVATHLPLLSLIGYLLLWPRPQLAPSAVLVVALLATLLGTALLLWLLHQLLAPVVLAGHALRHYIAEAVLPGLPVHFDDEAGHLLRDVQHAVEVLDARQRHLRLQAQQDHLTALLNRRAIEEVLQEALQQNALLPGGLDATRLCLAIIDIDRFKQVNDCYGHAVGDRVLVLLAAHLRAALRDDDWVARWGGEEFVLAFQAAPGDLPTILGRVHQPLRVSLVEANLELEVTLSIGATWAEAGDSLTQLFGRADAALYTAKSEGRDRWSVMQPG